MGIHYWSEATIALRNATDESWKWVAKPRQAVEELCKSEGIHEDDKSRQKND